MTDILLAVVNRVTLHDEEFRPEISVELMMCPVPAFSSSFGYFL